MTWQWLLAILAAYLVGAIPFGVIIGRMKGVDIRQHGSRNIGATNVTRVLGKRFGIACFTLDMLKGLIPVLTAGVVFGVVGQGIVPIAGGDEVVSATEMLWWLAVAAASILGHMYSVFLGFRGGKGVATGFGAMLGMWNLLTLPAIFAVVVWYTTLRLTRYVGLASVLAAMSLPLWCAIYFVPGKVEVQPLSQSVGEWGRAWPLYGATFALGLLVMWKHRGNLSRIRRGEEPKVGGAKRRGDFLNDPPDNPPDDPPGDHSSGP